MARTSRSSNRSRIAWSEDERFAVAKTIGEGMTRMALSQSALAARTGISRPMINRFVLGHRKPTPDQAALLERVLGVRLDECRAAPEARRQAWVDDRVALVEERARTRVLERRIDELENALLATREQARKALYEKEIAVFARETAERTAQMYHARSAELERELGNARVEPQILEDLRLLLRKATDGQVLS